jgi:CHASE1-domain containing sensor protein
MDRLKLIGILTAVFLFLGLITATGLLYKHAQKQKMLYERELKFQRVRAIKDSVEKRQLIRAHEDALFQYRDSVRQQKIEYITLQNEKSRKKIREVIRFIPNASSQYRDSLWTTEWERQDSTTYR